jgi:ERCC4-type nuclease
MSELERKLVIDSREKNLSVAEAIAEQCPIPIVFEQLDEGDYSVDGILCQRKSIDDLGQSILDKRLFKQVEKMVQNSSKAYLLIAGTLDQKTVRIHDHCIIGALAKISAIYDITIFWLTSEENLAYAMMKIFEWHGKIPKIKVKKKPKGLNISL